MWRESGGSLTGLGAFYRESGGSLVAIGAIYREQGGSLTKVWPSAGPVSDDFPTGNIDSIGEFKEVDLSANPTGDVTVKWERFVSASTSSATASCSFPSASASLEITCYINGVEEFVVSYGASAVGENQSDSDSGDDSRTVSGLSAGDTVRLEVTDRTVSAGCQAGASAGADPQSCDYTGS